MPKKFLQTQSLIIKNLSFSAQKLGLNLVLEATDETELCFKYWLNPLLPGRFIFRNYEKKEPSYLNMVPLAVIPDTPDVKARLFEWCGFQTIFLSGGQFALYNSTLFLQKERLLFGERNHVNSIMDSFVMLSCLAPKYREYLITDNHCKPYYTVDLIPKIQN